MKPLRIVIVTGLSGAGKSEALRILEDLGFFCVDNLPPALLATFAELCQGSHLERVALVIDIRGGDFFDTASEALEALERAGYAYRILYLEASDEELVRRFKETRRRHPLAPQGRVLDGIAVERRRLEGLRGRAHRIVDTTELSPRELRQRIAEDFASDPGLPRLLITLLSFGFKRGVPQDADLVFDLRFLPNPHYVDSLRHLTGDDPAVEEYVLRWPVTQQFLERLWALIEFLLPQYVNEGKSHLTIALGCTGGQHRSVVLANWLARRIRQYQSGVVVRHRDVGCDASDDEDDGEELP